MVAQRNALNLESNIDLLIPDQTKRPSFYLKDKLIFVHKLIRIVLLKLLSITIIGISYK